MPSIRDRLRNSWNAFMNRDPTRSFDYRGGSTWGSRPDRTVLHYGNAKSEIGTIYNKIAVDCSLIDLRHVIVDRANNNRYQKTVFDEIQEILSTSANCDQTGRAMVQDLVMSMFDEGVIAIVSTDFNINPTNTDSFVPLRARVGRITEWMPAHIRVEVYNELIGRKEEIVVEKRYTPIIENPFYQIMNEQNSLARQLITTLNQLARTNEQNASGKIDLLIQLPYAVRQSGKRDLAESRRDDIEKQLTNSQHGIAYIDASEKVIQLNRAVENNLWEQATSLRQQLYNQLGYSEAIFNGTADEQTMLNYQNSTIEPVLTAISEEITRKWLSKTARSQGHMIRFFKSPFKLVPTQQLAEISDKMTRNEILTSNEIRAEMGILPSDDPKADMLINSNINQSKQQELQYLNPKSQEKDTENIQND